jgi:hypothetical protein
MSRTPSRLRDEESGEPTPHVPTAGSSTSSLDTPTPSDPASARSLPGASPAVAPGLALSQPPGPLTSPRPRRSHPLACQCAPCLKMHADDHPLTCKCNACPDARAPPPPAGSFGAPFSGVAASPQPFAANAHRPPAWTDFFDAWQAHAALGGNLAVQPSVAPPINRHQPQAALPPLPPRVPSPSRDIPLARSGRSRSRVARAKDSSSSDSSESASPRGRSKARHRKNRKHKDSCRPEARRHRRSKSRSPKPRPHHRSHSNGSRDSSASSDSDASRSPPRRRHRGHVRSRKSPASSGGSGASVLFARLSQSAQRRFARGSFVSLDELRPVDPSTDAPRKTVASLGDLQLTIGSRSVKHIGSSEQLSSAMFAGWLPAVELYESSRELSASRRLATRACELLMTHPFGVVQAFVEGIRRQSHFRAVVMTDVDQDAEWRRALTVAETPNNTREAAGPGRLRPQRTATPATAKEICRNFNNGRCRRGERCARSHKCAACNGAHALPDCKEPKAGTAARAVAAPRS